MERFGLQGFQCNFFGCMNKTDGPMAATGNCMTVSVVGAALSAVFRHLSQAAHCTLLSLAVFAARSERWLAAE